jgi:CDP-diglyceride synthetase
VVKSGPVFQGVLAKGRLIGILLLATVAILAIPFTLVKSSPRLIFSVGLLFWLAAGIVWMAGRLFPATTYKWTILLLPWSLMILVGAALLLVGAVRMATSRRQS